MTNQGQAPKGSDQADGIVLSAGTHARWWHDPDTDRVRPSVLADQVTAARLIYGLRNQRVTGSTSGAATDLPEPLQSVTQTYVALRYAGRPIYSSIGSVEEMGIILDLFEAAGRPCQMPMHLISPLRFEGQELEIILAHKGRLSGVHVGNMPICGASAPVFLPGGLVVLSGRSAGWVHADAPAVHRHGGELLAGAALHGLPARRDGLRHARAQPGGPGADGPEPPLRRAGGRLAEHPQHGQEAGPASVGGEGRQRRGRRPGWLEGVLRRRAAQPGRVCSARCSW